MVLIPWCKMIFCHHRIVLTNMSGRYIFCSTSRKLAFCLFEICYTAHIRTLQTADNQLRIHRRPDFPAQIACHWRYWSYSVFWWIASSHGWCSGSNVRCQPEEACDVKFADMTQMNEDFWWKVVVLGMVLYSIGEKTQWQSGQTAYHFCQRWLLVTLLCSRCFDVDCM